MIDDDLVAEQYERRLRGRGRIGWVLGGAALGAIALLLGHWCRTLAQQATRPPRTLSAEEQTRLAPMIAEGERLAAPYDDTVPAGLREAIAALDIAQLVDTPPCSEHAPGGARAFTTAELAAAPVRPRRKAGRAVVVLGTHRAPRLASLTEYYAGGVDGVAYLWDDARGAIVCAGTAHAESADRVDFIERHIGLADARAALDRDLAVALDRDVAGNLRHVAP